MTLPDLSLAWSFHDRGVGTAPLCFPRLARCYTPMSAPNAPRPNVHSISVGAGEWSLCAPSTSVVLAATGVLIAALPLWPDSPSKASPLKGVSQNFVYSCRAGFGLPRMLRQRLSRIGRFFYPMARGLLSGEEKSCAKFRRLEFHMNEEAQQVVAPNGP